MNAIERAARVAALSRKLEQAVKEKDWNAAATVAAAINVHTSFLHDLASELRAETAIPALPAPEPEKKGKGARPFSPRPGHMTRYVTKVIEGIVPCGKRKVSAGLRPNQLLSRKNARVSVGGEEIAR